MRLQHYVKARTVSCWLQIREAFDSILNGSGLNKSKCQGVLTAGGSFVKQTLDETGFSFVWKCGPHSGNFLSQLKQRIWDNDNSEMLSKVSEMKSLQFYKKVIEIPGWEFYIKLGNKSTGRVLRGLN